RGRGAGTDVAEPDETETTEDLTEELASSRASAANGNGVAEPDAPAATAGDEPDEAEPPPPPAPPPRTGPGPGDLLVQGELITSDQLQQALLSQESSGVKLGAALVSLGVLDERTLMQALAQQLSLEVIDLRREAPSAEALAMLPEKRARTL